MIEDIVLLMLLIPDTKEISCIPVFDTETIFSLYFYYHIHSCLQGLKLQMIESESNWERLNTGEIHYFEKAY